MLQLHHIKDISHAWGMKIVQVQTVDFSSSNSRAWFTYLEAISRAVRDGPAVIPGGEGPSPLADVAVPPSQIPRTILSHLHLMKLRTDFMMSTVSFKDGCVRI